MRKVTKRFDIRHDAKYRLYQYLIPSFVFQSEEDIRNKKPQTDEEFNQLIEELRGQFSRYLKTHNYHNFTKRMKETDPKCNRYMVELSVNPVKKEQISDYCNEEKIESGVRWIRFTLLGQSFIYHQIRKMIGLLVQLRVRNLPIDETFKTALSTK
jgi:tRNA pseudouridine38-40 synthase